MNRWLIYVSFVDTHFIDLLSRPLVRYGPSESPLTYSYSTNVLRVYSASCILIFQSLIVMTAFDHGCNKALLACPCPVLGSLDFFLILRLPELTI